MGKSFHMSVDIAGALRRGDQHLDGILIDDSGRELSAQEVRAKFQQELSRGYSIFCGGCDNRDADGRCAGHEEPEHPEEGSMPMGRSVPETDSRWQRKDAKTDHGYTVIGITNTSHQHPRHPSQVVYRGDNGKLWSMALDEWPGNLMEIEK